MHKRLAPLALLALGLLGLQACGSPCQDLAERICNCQPAGTLRDSCKASVNTQIGALEPTAEDQARCSALLETCEDPESNPSQCERLQTQQGKEQCGLAFPADGGT